MPATLLVIAGLDPTGGAGLLADARVAVDHGVRVVGVTTGLTVQDTTGVRAANGVPGEILAEQLRTLLADVEVHAVKIGMLGSDRAAVAVGDVLAEVRAPIVWDPVVRSSRGVTLFAGDIGLAVKHLLRRVRVVTPNLDEAALLAGMQRIANVAAMRRAAAELREKGAQAVLVKGGHLRASRAVDVLHDGEVIAELDGERIDAGDVHGTGCVLSTAIACGLATGGALYPSVYAAKVYLASKLRQSRVVGRGARVLV